MLSLIAAIAGRPWAIRADVAGHVRGLIAREGIAGLRHFAGLKAAVHGFDGVPLAANGMRARASGTVAVVPIIGTLTQRGDVIESAETRSTAAIADEVSMAAADPKVDSVVLEIDSPGGEVYGVPEAWAAIREATKLKPIVACANSVSASAALYLASAATECWVTPSGETGSVGVYALHVNMSKALEDMGEEWEFIVADDSPHKVEGNPVEPLTDDARTQLKKTVNRYMGMFVRDLAKGRAVSMDHVRRNFGGGRMLGPQEALAAGLIDGVGTLSQAIQRAAKLGQEQRKGGASAVLVVPGPVAEVEPVAFRMYRLGCPGNHEIELPDEDAEGSVYGPCACGWTLRCHGGRYAASAPERFAPTPDESAAEAARRDALARLGAL